MNELLIATKNPGKMVEFRKILGDFPVTLVSLSDVGIDHDIEEDGLSYLENSQKKALIYSRESNLPAISDDGGLEIDALNGEPGVRSRRWLGHEATDEELVEHLKVVAGGIPEGNRGAWFRTVVSFALPNGEVYSESGEVRGELVEEPKLELLKGYPFRSFFYIPQIKKFYHELDLTPEEEKKYNHRYIALQKLIPIMRSKLK